MFTIVTWLNQKLFAHWSRGPARNRGSRRGSSIVSWFTQRVFHVGYVISPVAFLIAMWFHL